MTLKNIDIKLNYPNSSTTFSISIDEEKSFAENIEKGLKGSPLEGCLDLITKKCSSEFEKLKQDPSKLDLSKFKKFWQCRTLCSVGIKAREDYHNTLIGKISQLIDQLFSNVFGVKSELDVAKEMLENFDSYLFDSEFSIPEIQTEFTALKIEFARTTAKKQQKLFYCITQGTSLNPAEFLIAKQDGTVYRIPRIELIGQGAGRQVYKAYQYDSNNPAGKEIAIQTTLPIGSFEQLDDESKVNMLEESNQRMNKEHNHLKTLRGVPGIIQQDDFFEVKIANNDITFAVMELYPLGDLAHFLETDAGKNLTPDQTKHLIIKLMTLVDELHKRGLFHFDIKLQNIVIKYDNTKEKYEPILIDFECSMSKDKIDPTKDISTFAFMPPEYLEARISKEQETIKKTMGSAFDIWSLGAVIYHIIYGQPLISSDCIKNAPLAGRMKVARDALKEIKFPQGIDAETDELIRVLLHTDPNKRNVDIAFSKMNTTTELAVSNGFEKAFAIKKKAYKTTDPHERLEALQNSHDHLIHAYLATVKKTPRAN